MPIHPASYPSPAGRSKFLIEVCVSTIEDAIMAAELGADRLELSSALETDGVTPSLGMLQEVLGAVSIPVVTLVRLRSGDFVYDRREVKAMLHDAVLAMEAGSQAIAVGCLTAERRVDFPAMRMFAEAVGGKNCVCHRAIDQCADLKLAVDELCELGYRRALTSGGRINAIAGADSLHELRCRVADQLEILVAGGVSPGNLSELILRTGCDQFHGSFRKQTQPESPPRLDPIRLANAIYLRDSLPPKSLC
jgi:copper homeostasis protein